MTVKDQISNIYKKNIKKTIFLGCVFGFWSFGFSSLADHSKSQTVCILHFSKPVNIIVMIVAVLFLIFIIDLVIRAHKKKITTGKEGLLLEIGSAFSDIEQEGTVMVHGELWNAQSVEGKINKGEKVIVVKVTGTKIIVKRSN